MTDIRTLVIATLTGDATFRALTGWTADDPRIYWYFQADAVLSEAKPAYLTYNLIVRPEAPSAVVSPVIGFTIWGLELETVDLVAARLEALFDKQVLYTAGGKKLWGKLMNRTEDFQSEVQFAGQTLQFRFSWSTV